MNKYEESKIRVAMWNKLVKQVSIMEQLEAIKNRDWDEYDNIIKYSKNKDDALFSFMYKELSDYIKQKKSIHKD